MVLTTWETVLTVFFYTVPAWGAEGDKLKNKVFKEHIFLFLTHFDEHTRINSV